MNVERDLIASACDSRSAYEKIVSHLGTSDLTDTGQMVWSVIEDYYARDPRARNVNLDTLETLVVATVPNPKHKETLKLVVDGIKSSNTSGENVVHALLTLKREALGARLSSALLAGSANSELLQEYSTLLQATGLEEAEGEGINIVWGRRPSDDFGDDYSGSLIQMMPHSLNDRLGGGMMRGHHVIVFARPEMGKTSLLANFTAGFLKQDLKVLYLGNEDPIQDVTLKFLSRVLEVPRDDVVRDMRGAEDYAIEHNRWGNLGLAQIEPGNPWEIEAAVKRVQPDVLIIDQIRNLTVRGSKNDGMVQHLENAAKAVRQIGIRNKCLVISTTQAGDSATGKGILGMSDVDSSKTGIPAQAEVMIGIGASADDEIGGRRVFSLPKNKRTGQHGHFVVKADFVLSKFTSMG